MAQAITVVDAFTDRPYGGNQAAVCVLSAPTTEAWMAAVAAEMNLSETAFVVPRADGDHDLRWFTPTVEVDLCGHATLASAHVLGGAARFHTRSGALTCQRGPDNTIELDLPARPVTPTGDGSAWAPALGIDVDRIVAEHRGGDWVLVEVRSPDDVRAVVADRAAVLARGGYVLVGSAPGDPGDDSACRYFAPGAGIDEDPVTGSAHCLLGPWLAERTGRSMFTGRQVSARGGVVGMRVHGDRVIVSGQAVTMLVGTLRHDPPPT